MCIEDFVRLLTAEIRKMSEKGKAEFRRGWIRAMPRSIFQFGDQVLVTPSNGKTLKGEVTAVLDSVSGRRVRVISGPLVVTVDERQVRLIEGE